MNGFDALFYLMCLVLFTMLAAIIRLAMSGSRRRTFRLFRIFIALIVVYSAAILATKLATPVIVYAVGSWQLAGDWYLIVDSWYPEPVGDQKRIVVNFRLISHADHGTVSQRGLVAYLVDEDGGRYDALPQPSTPPFDVAVKPGQTIRTTRHFLLAGDPQKLELVVAHHGFQRSWFVIGRTPFDGTSAVQLQ